MPEIVIIGAGPAGLSAAKFLAEASKDVLVLEKNSKPGLKVCASGITNMSFNLGIPKSILEREFNHVLFDLEGLKLRVKDSGKIIYTTRRPKLGAWQAKLAKKAGAKIKYNAKVTAIGKNFVKAGKKKIRFKYLIGADGSNSIVRRHLRLTSKNIAIAIEYEVKGHFKELEVIFCRKFFKKCCAWVFPYKNSATVGTAYFLGDSAQEVKNNLDAWCTQRGYKIKSDLMAAPINFSYKGIKFGNKFLVGDAAGLAFDLTGEGIGSAIISGQEVARKILNPNYNFPKIKELLYIKNKQKKIREALRAHPYASRFSFFLMPLLIRIPQFKRKFLRAAGLR